MPLDEVKQLAADNLSITLMECCDTLVTLPAYQDSNEQLDYIWAVLEGYYQVVQDARGVCLQLISEMETK